MRLTIIPSDGVVGIDGVFRTVSMVGMDPTIHAVQFDDAEGEGAIEHVGPRALQVPIKDRARFDPFIKRWHAAAPIPEEPPVSRPPKDILDQIQELPPERLAMLKSLLL